MTTTQTLSPSQPAPKDEIIFPTGEFWSDEPPLESYLHLQQIILLMKCLEWLWQERKDYFAAGNLTIYYSPKELALQQQAYERQQKELALQKIEQLTARLRELGINPDETP